MRELKFRVWDLQRKYFSSEYDIYCSNGSVSSNGSGIVDPNGHHFIPQQYTGCKDKNGTPIYEGDILANDLILPHDNDNIGVVYFAAGTFMIDGDGPFFDHVYGHSPDILDNHTVIGNKFENPELLKV
jgi:uncharacterized phage protein (TIGR01671 family)